MASEHFDVLIVGAGLSGIGAGYHLQEKSPRKSYVILEGRDGIGGTWDLFRYPGIRSDSDMYTLGYSFKPWTEPKAIADGPRSSTTSARPQPTTASTSTSASTTASSARRGRRRMRAGRWRPSARVGEGAPETVRFTCNFLFMCSGYYKYEEGYTPEFAGVAISTAASCIRRNGPRISTTRESAWW